MDAPARRGASAQGVPRREQEQAEAEGRGRVRNCVAGACAQCPVDSTGHRPLRTPYPLAGLLPDGSFTTGAGVFPVPSPLTAASAAWNPIFECVPSQKGLLTLAPQRHSENASFPSFTLLLKS